MSSTKLARKVSIALDQLSERYESGQIGVEEYDNRMLAICVWAKRRILRKVVNINGLGPATYPTLPEWTKSWSIN